MPSNSEMFTRSLTVRVGTADEKARTVEAVMTTDDPVAVFDYRTYDEIRETLVVDGAKFGDQIPLLRMHSRYSLDDVIGSVRNIRKDGNKILGTMTFSTDEEAERAWTKVREGHLTDVSIGYRVEKFTDIAKGQKAVVNGREYQAGDQTLRVSTDWTIRELSVVPIGADQKAKIREDNRPEIVGRGEIIKETNMDNETKVEAPVIPQPETQRAADKVVDVDALREAGAKAERDRQANIRKLAGDDVPAATLQKALDEGWDTARASAEFLKAIREARPDPVKVEIGSTGGERLADALSLEICTREGVGDRSKATAEFRGVGLQDIARIVLRNDHIDPPHNADRLFERAISTGSSFTNLLGSSSEKMLTGAYAMTPSTFMMWAGQRSVSNFRSHNEITLGTFAAISEIGEGGRFKHNTISEKKESYQAKTRGTAFAVTRQMFVNDDLSAFSRIPTEIGRAMKLDIDDLGYALLVSASGVGPTMAEDSVALFYARTTPNYLAAATATLGDTSLATGKQYMRQVTGLGGRVMNLKPQYLLVPATLEHTAKKLIQSSEIQYFYTTPTTGDAAATLHPTANVHQNSLNVIVDGRLDAATDGTTAWYLVANPADAASLVVCFLNGRTEPFIERNDPTDTLGVGWRAYHDVGVAAVDWRGIFRSKGAA